MAGYPGDVQTVISQGDLVLLVPDYWDWWYWVFWDDSVETLFLPPDSPPSGDDGGVGTAAFDCQRAIILCHPDTPLHPPACFIARFPGRDATSRPMHLMASGRISENIFTTEPNTYEDEPVLVYRYGGVRQLMLAQELQSTGDDVFVSLMRTGLQPTPGLDSHRLEAIEPLLRRGAGVHPGTQEMTVAPVTSNVLDARSGDLGAGSLLPGLNDTIQPVKAPIGVLQTARWMGRQLFGATTNSVFRYLGAILRGRRLS